MGYWWKGETLVSVGSSPLDVAFASAGPPLMTESQEESQQQQQQQPEQKPTAPANSREDIVLIPAGGGKPKPYSAVIWEMDWAIREREGENLLPPGSKYASSVVALTEKVSGQKDFKPGGSQKGGFSDLISMESRIITQRFTVDGKRVQVVLGRDAQGNLIKTWDLKVTIKYPNRPEYSPGP